MKAPLSPNENGAFGGEYEDLLNGNSVIRTLGLNSLWHCDFKDTVLLIAGNVDVRLKAAEKLQLRVAPMKD